MGFRIISADITELPADVVVNSLGVCTTAYGSICRSIISKANSPELEQIIEDKNGKIKVGDMFFTDGYGLPAKKILHVVTPFKENDPDLIAIETLFRDILIECFNKGFESIAIPIIGTGSNGYTTVEIQKMLFEMCGNFSDISIFENFDISIIKKPERGDILQGCLNDDWYYARLKDDIDEQVSDFIKNHSDVERARDYNYDFFAKKGPILPPKYVKKASTSRHNTVIVMDNPYAVFPSIPDYARSYLAKRYANDWKKADEEYRYFRRCLGTNTVYDMENGRVIEPPRIRYFQAIIALKMNLKEATEFLGFFGLIFNQTPFEKNIKSFITKGFYNWNEIDIELRQKCRMSLTK